VYASVLGHCGLLVSSGILIFCLVVKVDRGGDVQCDTGEIELGSEQFWDVCEERATDAVLA
jgi:hypothetical protein